MRFRLNAKRKKTEERLVAYGIRTPGQLEAIGMGSLTRLILNAARKMLPEILDGVPAEARNIYLLRVM